MSWLAIVGILTLVALIYRFKKRVDATPDPSREEIVRTIDDFLSGRGGLHDWDNFTTFPLKDPTLESLRRECFEVGIVHRGRKKSEWCSDDGIAELRRIRARIASEA